MNSSNYQRPLYPALFVGVFLAIVCFLPVTTVAIQDDDSDVTIKQVTGVWRLVALSRGGHDAPKSILEQAGIYWVCDGKRYSSIASNEVVEQGKIRFGGDATPRTLDHLIEVGKDKGKEQLSIVRFNDGKLQFCQSDLGDSRPEKFASTRDNSFSLATFQKADDKESKKLLAIHMGKKIDDEESVENMKKFDSDDEVMNAAIRKAQKTIDTFIDAMKHPSGKQSLFAIKVRMDGDDDVVEHFWANNVTFDGKSFKATINNDPRLVDTVKIGDRVTVAKSDISDWMFVDDEVLVGGQTIRVVRDQMNTAERRQFDRSIPFKVK